MLVNALSTSYVGMPEMCNLMSGWAREFDIDPVEVMQEVLKEQLMERFDPESVDRDFMSGAVRPIHCNLRPCRGDLPDISKAGEHCHATHMKSKKLLLPCLLGDSRLAHGHDPTSFLEISHLRTVGEASKVCSSELCNSGTSDPVHTTTPSLHISIPSAHL